MTVAPTARPQRRTGGSSTLLDEHLDRRQAEALADALERAEALLAPGSLPALDEVVDFETATQALHRGWQEVRAVSLGGTAVARRLPPPDLERLVDDMVACERVVRSAETARRQTLTRAVGETLAELRGIDDVGRLVEAGAEAICRIGFDRAIVSRVEDSTWVTEAIRIDGDEGWAEEILAAGRAEPQQLYHGLPEQDVVRRRRPVLVTRVQEKEEVHRAVAATSQSRSYVAAPLAPSGRVLGFVHADRYFHRGEVTQLDADLLGLFAQGYSFALECAMVRTELDALRRRVHAFSEDLRSSSLPTQDPLEGRTSWVTPVDHVTRHACGSGVPSFGPATGVPSAPAGPSPMERFDLTRREVDVFRLMAQGETNHRIGTRLGISEGTVKSHVKHVLRKLGAANRAEAVAVWHRAAAG